ncbi:MAG: DUF3099 domain-containing protein [Streptosporangiales bacterium]
MKLRGRRSKRAVPVTDAARPYSEDIDARRRRYLFWMAVRTVCFALAIILVLVLNGTARVIAFFVVAIPAIFLPMLTVVFANAGREPSGGRFETYDPEGNQLEAPAESEQPADRPADASSSGESQSNQGDGRSRAYTATGRGRSGDSSPRNDSPA